MKIDSFEEKLEDFTYNEIQRPNQMNPNYENSLKSTQDSRTQSAFNGRHFIMQISHSMNYKNLILQSSTFQTWFP